MGSHTLSHADRFKAGNAVVFNDTENPNKLRGLPVRLMAVESFAAVAASDPDGIALSQTPAAGGQQDLALAGAFVTDGVATLPVVSVVSITAAANETARTFTVIGLDANGRPQAEEIAGPNATVAEGVKTFSQVTRIFVDDDTAGAVTAGQSNDQIRGLRAKSDGLLDFFVVTEDGAGIVAAAFDPGNNTAQTATTADQRAKWTPQTATAAISVMYAPDLTKEGIGANYVDASQSVPSAI
jgi:hypothetical protein